MMYRFIVLLLVFIVPVHVVNARKEYKQIRASIKTGNALDQAMKLVAQHAKDSVLRDDPELYFLASEVQKKVNDAQNLRMYLKQKADTNVFFSSVHGIFEYLLLCDEKERKLLQTKKRKSAYNSKIHSTLKMYYPNLFNGGIYFLKKKNYNEADKFFSMYVNAAKSPVMVKDNLIENDVKMPRAAFWSMTSCFENKNYKDVFKFDNLVMKDTANWDYSLRYKAMSSAFLKDTVQMVKELYNGIRMVPEDLFFFSHLTDYYNSIKDYGRALNLCDSLIQTDEKQLMYKFGKSVELFHLKRYDECIELSKIILQNDSSNVESYYYIASCYFNEATEIDDKISPDLNRNNYKKQKDKVKSLLREALPYMEAYRAKRPEDSARWAAPLYRIYLSLNMGKQFAEIDKLMKAADTPKVKSQ